MSRPAGPDRVGRFEIRLTKEERAVLDALAKAEGVGVSTLFRQWLRQQAKKAGR